MRRWDESLRDLTSDEKACACRDEQSIALAEGGFADGGRAAEDELWRSQRWHRRADLVVPKCCAGLEIEGELVVRAEVRNSAAVGIEGDSRSARVDDVGIARRESDVLETSAAVQMS